MLIGDSHLSDATRMLEGRQSVRRYAGQDIGDSLLEQLLYCATRAPSAHNRQPWRFAVLREADIKARLAQMLGDRLRRDRLADGDDPAAVEADVSRSFARISNAPVVIVFASSLVDMDRYPDARRAVAEAAMAMQSTAMAVQNFLLAASVAGLGACWMCAPLFSPDVVCEALGLPADWQPQGLVTLGVPAGTPRKRERRDLREVVRYIST